MEFLKRFQHGIRSFRRYIADDTQKTLLAAMVNKAVVFFLFRILLPFGLIAAVICRQNVLSLVYLLLLLVAPVVPLPSQTSMASHTGRYLKIVLGYSIAATVAQIIFQVVLLSLQPYGYFLDNCSFLEKLLRHIGFQRYNLIDPLQAARLIGPEVLMLFVSTVVFVPCDKMTAPTIPKTAEGEPSSSSSPQMSSPTPGSMRKRRAFTILSVLGNVIAMILLAAAGNMRPSITSSVYFLSFLAIATWVACNKKLSRNFAIFRIFLLVFAALHLIVLYLYQMQISQELISPESLYARLFGLTGMVVTSCVDPRNIEFLSLEWATYVNPTVLLALYWVLVMETTLWLSLPLLSADGLPRHYNSVEGTASNSAETEVDKIEIDPNGSVILSNVDMDAPTSEDPRRFPISRLKQLISPVMSVLMLIMRQSYIATLIVMMAYSITYHCWLTFVLLLWSCILWMMPSSRKACLKSSPALVMYAEALLIIQYIYGLSLTDVELPQEVIGVNLRQIGFVKYPYLPVIPLTVKVLYTVMFWITLRQYMKEKFEEKNRDIAEGVMMQPFAVAYSTAQAGTPSVGVQYQTNTHTTSPFMQKLGELVLRFLTTYWIWIVACMLMVISLQGEKVVIFQIMYMALFLFFILNFQLSYRLWRSTMYFFWLTVIIYSMLVLILIYTYQFENFPWYWSNYLGISTKLQGDIGLKVYDTGQLFLKLLSPTFFVVITIIQLHYFHKDFLRISDIDHRSDDVESASPNADEQNSPSENPNSVVTDGKDSKILQKNGTESDAEADMSESEMLKSTNDQKPVIIGIPSTPTGDEQQKEFLDSSDEQKTKEPSECETEHSWKEALLGYLKTVKKYASKIFDAVSEFLWRFLEIHMIKIVLFAALMLAVYDVCAVHVIFVFLVTVALPFRPVQLFVSHCCAIWSSVLLLSKMIYQIDYVEEEWTINCTDVKNLNVTSGTGSYQYPFNDTINNAHWMGYRKVTDLPDYLKGYIGIIIVLSIQAVIRVRQRYHRNQTDATELKPGVIFRDIGRADADDGLLECLKYLVNYAFYKFGVEICFMTNVAVIGVRLDIFAVAYAIWLGCMFLLKRTTLAKVWPFYVAFLAILLCIQYCLCVGMPPGFCIEYPWSVGHIDPELREWLYLPDFSKPLAAYKLAVDFFLLLFACCQMFVFQIEVSPTSESYEGGSNREIIYIGLDEPEENPIPDFVTYTKSYLDLVKVVVFSLFYWITLAIIFLAGTNRVSLFAMGYVIGCFLFLWNGQDFYLKPLKTILRLWNTLLAYNIFVIFIKTMLQMVGCVFIERMLDDFCWTIQLFGIACLKKFDRHYSTATKLGDCTVPEDEAGLLWDGICLGFMLMQRRLFCSYYFHHLVVEMHAQTKLASRGAELINQLLMKEVRVQETAEREIVEKIKKKMDRIRANQRKIRGKEYSETQDHFQAIRSGDYYMFEEYSDDGLAELEYPDKKSDEKDDEPGVMTVTKLLASAMKSDIKRAVHEAKQVKGSQSPDTGVSRQASSEVSGRPPVSRTVSAVSGASSLPVGMSVSRQASLRSQGYAEMEQPPAFPSAHPTDEGRGYSTSGYDDYGAVEDRESRSPPLLDLEAALKAPHGDIEDEDAPEIEEGLYRKTLNWLKFLGAFIEGLMISATLKLKLISHDYRYVARCLAKEKKLLKEKGLVSAQSLKTDYSESLAQRPPSPQLQSLYKNLEEPLEIRVEKASEDQTDGSLECLDTPEQLEKEFEKEQPLVIRLSLALWYALVSRSELVCYVMIMINQIKSASLLSLPLPFMAFLWGTLSIPRPTKTFWVTIITYTEAVVVLKYLFQFEFFPWNEGDPRLNQPFWPPRIIGVEKNEHYAVYDLLLLLVIFFHRFILKSLGLWKDDIESAQSVESLEDIGADTKSVEEKSKEPKSTENLEQSDDSVERDAVPYEEMESEQGKPVSKAVLDCILNYTQPFQRFFHNLFHPSYRVSCDVYAYMFVCDFVTFLILVFGYWAFGPGGGDGGVTSYFDENTVPVPFLVMLIAQFGLIIIDRALFLRKFILGKVIFQVVMVFIVHLWMFFVLPAVTERDFNSSLPPQLWYMVKFIYLLLSAYQIRSGYPTRILGNFLTKKYNYLNQFLFRGFMAIPFLFELRALMDWIWTDTSMSLSSWLKMEDIFQNIFLLKCQRRAEAEYPTPSGEKRNPLLKYAVGGLLLFVIIFIIWFPLVLFALGNTVGMPNPPYDVTVEISFGAYQPLFKMSAQHNSLMPFTDKQYNDLSYMYRRQRDATAFLQNYDERDIVMVELGGNSTAVWGISPPSQEELIKDLTSQNMITLKFAWHISRNSSNTEVTRTVGDEMLHFLKPDDPTRAQFAAMLNGSDLNSFVVVQNFFPKFIRVYGKAKAPYVKQLLTDRGGNVQFSNLTLGLRAGSYANDTSIQQWWEVREDCENSRFQSAPFQKDCDSVRIITLNDKVFPSTLSILSGMGIVGLYTTMVLVASRFVRSLFSGVSYHIMFDDMPYVDRVLQLCLDIYLVRESGELHLEEDLFAKLIFLYRSPETLIKWTRYPQRPNSP